MNIFDIIGPIMIGPSSSHTAGAVRIGRIAWKILGENAAKAKISLMGSFASTYKGHGTDKALIAGILGMQPDDNRIRHSLEIASENGLAYSFKKTNRLGAHPNTVVIDLVGVHGAHCVIEGASVGGGNIEISKLNGMESVFTGQRDTLIIAHLDKPGLLAAVTGTIASFGVNIGDFDLARPKKRELAIMTIVLDSGITEEQVHALEALEDVVNVVYLRPLSLE